jgi:HK97 family phage major capsid protein
VLLDHDTRDIVGVVESVRLDGDKVLRGVLRFGRSARAEEAWQDVQDGIRTKISVGYQVDAWETTKGRNGAPDEIRVTSWMPLEVSFVAVPADASVGVGRAFDNPPAPRPASTEVRMPDITHPPVAAPQGGLSPDQIRANAVTETLEIRAMAERLKLGSEADQMLRSGASNEQIRSQLLDLLVTRSNSPTAPPAVVQLTEKEHRQYSIARALYSQAFGEKSFEREISDELQKRLGRQTNGILIPTNLQMQQRALDATVAATAKNLIANEGVTFIELLRAQSLVLAMGATYLPGMVGNIPFARQITGGNAQWTGDNPGTGASNSDPTLETFTMSPKQLMAHRQYSKQLLVQTGGFVDRYIMEDLSAAHSLEVDRASLFGSGSSNQPLGIANVAGIGAVAGGTNGLAPTWDHIVQLETEVAIDNALVGNTGYLTNPKVRGKLKTTQKFASTNGMPVWESGDSPLNGYKAGVTNQVSSTLTKGTASGICSAIFFGNWKELLVLEWGALDVITDPYTLADKGLVRAISTQLVDINQRHIQSFSAMLDALAG